MFAPISEQSFIALFLRTLKCSRPTIRSRFQALRCCALALIVGGLCFDNTINAQEHAFAADGTAQVMYPENGPVIGQGLALDTGLASTNVCITGGVRVGTPAAPLPQVTAVFVHAATDASTSFHQAGLSASAQVKGLVGSGGVTVSYISSQSFLRSSSLLSVEGRTEQRQYIVPSGAAPKEGEPLPDLAISKSISLTPHAVQLAQRDYAAFRKECGDGFIAVLVEGAELTGTVEVRDESSDAMSNTAASLNGTYGPASFDLKMTELTKSSSSSSSFSFSYLESGGTGQVVPTNQAGLTQALSNLPQVAQSAPQPLYVIARDYVSLPNWPKHVAPFHKDADTLSQLMDLYWRINAVYQQAMDAQTSLTNPQQMRYMVGFNFTVATLDQLLDQIKQMRAQVSAAALECYNLHSCKMPAQSVKDVYAYAVQLPLPVPPQTPASRTFFAQLLSIESMVNTFNTQKLQRVFAVHDLRDPTCFQENNKVTKQFEAEGFPNNIQSSLDQFRAFLAALPGQLRDDAVAYYGRDLALRRCADSPTSPDCSITTTQFQAMGSAIPLHGLSVKTNFYPSIDEYGPCPGGVLKTPQLTFSIQ